MGWATAMLNGVIGIVPKSKIRRTIPTQYNIERHQNNDLFDDYESQKEPLTIHTKKITRTRVLKIVGNFLTHNGSNNYNPRFLRDKAMAVCAILEHQM